MKRICFITGTRAEYGIMQPLMEAVKNHPDAEIQIIATNAHLSPEYGLTVNEITAAGFSVDAKIESLLASDTPSGTAKTMGLTQIGLADALERLKPDLTVILGDRHEMLATASAALVFGIPIAHLHGGETTEGAYDDSIRHAITKMATLHFAATPEYAGRIISMGENPQNVFWTGALGVENVRKHASIPRDELEQSLGIELGNRVITATYHPVTRQPGEELHQISDFTKALQPLVDKGWKIIVTLPNSDAGGRTVTAALKDWETHNPGKVKTFPSLGRKRYFSLIANSTAVVGNSSSGIIEVPSFGIPTLDIGDRQKGRARAESVVNCPPDCGSIAKGLDKILSDDFRAFAKTVQNPYDKPGTCDTILNALLAFNT